MPPLRLGPRLPPPPACPGGHGAGHGRDADQLRAGARPFLQRAHRARCSADVWRRLCDLLVRTRGNGHHGARAADDSDLLGGGNVARLLGRRSARAEIIGVSASSALSVSAPIACRWLGRVTFADALALQEQLVAAKIAAPDAPDTLLLL